MNSENRMIRPTKTENVGIVNYTEFGTLKQVEDVGSYVRIFNETGWYADMKKVYINWAKVMLKAQDLIDKDIVIETGATSSATDYFRDLCEDTNHILDVPSDAGPHAKAVMIVERVNSSNKTYMLRKAQQWAEAEQKRQEEAAEKDSETIDDATRQLDLEWPKFELHRKRQFLVTGAAWTKESMPKNVDKKMALRLGFSTMKKKRINVIVLARHHRNYVQVQLPDHDNMICRFAIKPSDHEKTRGEWAIASIDPEIPGWFDMEKKHFPDIKTYNEPIEWFLERNKDMLKLLTRAA